MSRTLTAPVSTACAADVVKPAYLVELVFDSGPLRMWTGRGEYNWSATGRVFQGVGDLLAVSDVEETQRVEANGITLTLSGVDSSNLSYALGQNYRNRRARVWLALFDPATGNLIADPVSVFAGRMDTMKITDAATSAQIAITCESKLIDLQRARERRYTHEDQIDLYPGDLGLEYVAGLQEREIAWGKAEPK
jgi:hypothetical protein